MRENYPKIKHFFDVWHVAKGIKKKLLAKGKQKGFELLKVWAPSLYIGGWETVDTLLTLNYQII